jgi:hypothetical protein
MQWEVFLGGAWLGTVEALDKTRAYRKAMEMWGREPEELTIRPSSHQEKQLVALHDIED